MQLTNIIYFNKNSNLIVRNVTLTCHTCVKMILKRTIFALCNCSFSLTDSKFTDNDDNTSHYHSKVVMKVALEVFKN
jgi:hypothetical protein